MDAGAKVTCDDVCAICDDKDNNGNKLTEVDPCTRGNWKELIQFKNPVP